MANRRLIKAIQDNHQPQQLEPSVSSTSLDMLCGDNNAMTEMEQEALRSKQFQLAAKLEFMEAGARVPGVKTTQQKQVDDFQHVKSQYNVPGGRF